MSDHAVLCEQYRLHCSGASPSYLEGPTVAVDLNETAVEILRRCQQPRPVQGIVDDVVALYVGAPPDEIERSVRDFLDAALSKGWLRRLVAGR